MYTYIHTHIYTDKKYKPSQTGGEGGLGHLWTPQWQQAVTFGVRVLQFRTLPLLPAACMSANKQKTRQ